MKAQPADIIRQEDIKLTPELIIIFTPLTFIAGNWYLSALFILSAFAFLFLRYFSFKDHEISFSQMIPWGLMLLWGLYVCYITPDPEKAVKYYTGTMLLPFFIFILFKNIRLDEKTLTRFFDSMLISGAVIGMYSVYIFISYNMRSDMRVPSFWNDFNMVSMYLMILFMFNLSFLIKSRHSNKIYFYLFTITFILLGIYLTKTRGVWLAMIVSIAVFFIRKPKIIIPVFLFFGVISLLFFNIIEERFLSVVNFDQDKSSLGRLQAWYSTVLIIFKNPFFGYGFDTYYLHKYDVFPYYIVDVPHPHNTYLRAIQELGLIGAVIYFFLFFKATVLSFTSGRSHCDPVYLKYFDGLQLSFIGLIIAFNFEPYLSLFGVTTIVVWILVSLTFRLKDMPAAEKIKTKK